MSTQMAMFCFWFGRIVVCRSIFINLNLDCEFYYYCSNYQQMYTIHHYWLEYRSICQIRCFLPQNIIVLFPLNIVARFDVWKHTAISRVIVSKAAGPFDSTIDKCPALYRMVLRQNHVVLDREPNYLFF